MHITYNPLTQWRQEIQIVNVRQHSYGNVVTLFMQKQIYLIQAPLKNDKIKKRTKTNKSQTNLTHSHPASDPLLLSSCCTGCASVHDAPDCGAARWPPLHHACRSYLHSWGGGSERERTENMDNVKRVDRSLPVYVFFSL